MGSSASQHDDSFDSVTERTVQSDRCLLSNRAVVSRKKDGRPAWVNGYKVLRLLGEGRYGEVFLCRKFESRVGQLFPCVAAHEDFAIKLVRRKQAREQECRILMNIAHPNVVRLLEYIDDDTSPYVYLVFERLAGGAIATCNNLGDLGPLGTQPWSEAKSRPLFYQMASALAYLHAHSVFHRDLKPENVVYVSMDQTQVKLIDFGESRMLKTKGIGDDSSRATRGTPFFNACEMQSGKHFQENHVDVWALGVLFYLLLVGRVPFGYKCTSRMLLLERIQNDPLDLPEGLSPPLQDLLKKMLHRSLALRVTAPYIVQHPFFTAEFENDVQCPFRAKGAPVMAIKPLDSDSMAQSLELTEAICVTPVESCREKEQKSNLSVLLDRSTNGRPKRILIVEDQVRIREQMKKYMEHAKQGTLELEFVELVYAEDALAALTTEESAHESQYDLAIIDVYPFNKAQQPLTGLDVITSLRSFEQDNDCDPLPVCISTTEGERLENLEEFAEKLNCSVVRKPFSPEQVYIFLRALGVRYREIPQDELESIVENKHVADRHCFDSAMSNGLTPLEESLTNMINLPADMTSHNSSDDTVNSSLSLSLRSKNTPSVNRMSMSGY